MQRASMIKNIRRKTTSEDVEAGSGRRGGGLSCCIVLIFALKICDYYIKGDEGRASPEDLEFFK